jgi:gamma-glutamyl phosphate reductase
MSKGFLLEVPFEFQYTDRMKNNKSYYQNLDSDDRSQHLFYMTEELEELVRYIGNEMSVENAAFASRMNVIEEIIDRLSGMSDRIKKENEAEKTAKAISYAI